MKGILQLAHKLLVNDKAKFLALVGITYSWTGDLMVSGSATTPAVKS